MKWNRLTFAMYLGYHHTYPSVSHISLFDNVYFLLIYSLWDGRIAVVTVEKNTLYSCADTYFSVGRYRPAFLSSDFILFVVSWFIDPRTLAGASQQCPPLSTVERERWLSKDVISRDSVSCFSRSEIATGHFSLTSESVCLLANVGNSISIISWSANQGDGVSSLCSAVCLFYPADTTVLLLLATWYLSPYANLHFARLKCCEHFRLRLLASEDGNGFLYQIF